MYNMIKLLDFRKWIGNNRFAGVVKMAKY